MISFGYSKIIDCGSGGCILTDNKKLHENLKKKLSKNKQKTEKS